MTCVAPSCHKLIAMLLHSHQKDSWERETKKIFHGRLDNLFVRISHGQLDNNRDETNSVTHGILILLMGGNPIRNPIRTEKLFDFYC